MGVWVRKWLGSNRRRRGPRGPGEQRFWAVEEPGPSRGPRVSLGSARCGAAPWRGGAGRGGAGGPCWGFLVPQGTSRREALPDRPASGPPSLSALLCLSAALPPPGGWRSFPFLCRVFPCASSPAGLAVPGGQGLGWLHDLMAPLGLGSIFREAGVWRRTPSHQVPREGREPRAGALRNPLPHTPGLQGQQPPYPHPCFCQGSERGGDLPTATGRGSRQRGGGTPGGPPAGGGHSGASGQAQPRPEGRKLPNHPSGSPAPARPRLHSCSLSVPPAPWPQASSQPARPPRDPVPAALLPGRLQRPEPGGGSASSWAHAGGGGPAAPGLRFPAAASGSREPEPSRARALEAAPLPCPSPGGQRPNAAQHRASRGLASAAAPVPPQV